MCEPTSRAWESFLLLWQQLAVVPQRFPHNVLRRRIDRTRPRYSRPVSGVPTSSVRSLARCCFLNLATLGAMMNWQ